MYRGRPARFGPTLSFAEFFGLVAPTMTGPTYNAPKTYSYISYVSDPGDDSPTPEVLKLDGKVRRKLVF